MSSHVTQGGTKGGFGVGETSGIIYFGSSWQRFFETEKEIGTNDVISKYRILNGGGKKGAL